MTIVENNINLINDRTVQELPDELLVTGSVFLDGCINLKKLPKRFFIEGSLSLAGCSNIEEFPELLIVGNNLFISSVNCNKFKTILVGGKVIDGADLQYAQLKDNTITDQYVFSDNHLVFYKNKISQYDYDCYKGIKKDEIVIVKGQYTSYCKDIKEGLVDVNYKELKDKETNKYDNVTIDTRFTEDEALLFYRYVTGACIRGCRKFLNTFVPYQETYSIQDIINTTKGLEGNKELINFMKDKGGKK